MGERSTALIPHTYGGFRAVFFVANGRAPTEQEIFDAGMRGGRDINWPKLPPEMTEEKFVALFEETIAEDPAAYGKVGETVYQVTRTELAKLFAMLNKA